MDSQRRSVSIGLAQYAVQRLEAQRPRGPNDCSRENSLEVVAAIGDRGPASAMPATELSQVSAVNVAFQMSDRGLLAGNDVLDQIADGNHAHNLVAIEHWQMPDMLVCHDTQTFIYTLTRMCRK